MNPNKYIECITNGLNDFSQFTMYTSNLKPGSDLKQDLIWNGIQIVRFESMITMIDRTKLYKRQDYDTNKISARTINWLIKREKYLLGQTMISLIKYFIF